MSDTSSRRARLALLWASGAVAALVLVLGVNGTLSSWTSAIILNSTNTVTTSGAVILQETSGSTTCTSSSSATNSSTCGTINKYGGGTLTPGASQQTTVTFTNIGTTNASTFSVTPAGCTQSPTAGTGTPPAANLCTNGDLTVAMSCVAGTTYTGTPFTDLVFAAGTPAAFNTGGTLTHTAGLAAGASITCRFTVALSATATVLDQGITPSQQMTWTLTA